MTYERSRDARVGEAMVKDVYTMVYDAHRPELFLKDAMWRRTVGPGESIGIREDSTWNVPEAEIGVVLGLHGRIAGYTIGNDVSSRDIEGANPLYLPQAKVYASACSIGPAILVASGADPVFEISLRILAEDGQELFAGTTSTARMRRSFEELVSWLLRDNPVPPGSVLLTGTGHRATGRVHPPPRAPCRDPRARNRHAGQPRGARRRARTAGKEPLMTETLTHAPARNYVGGEWRSSVTGETYEKRNPWRPSRGDRRLPGL